MTRLLHLLAAGFVTALAIDSFSLASRATLFLPPAAILLAIGWATWALAFLAREGGAVHRHRREIALAVGSTLFALALALAASMWIPMGRSANFERAHYDPRRAAVGQSSDGELGWAPFAGDDVVGQRLQAIDPARPHVVLVGDSILYGLNLQDAETAPEILNARRRDVQFLNASVSGWSIEQYWLYLRRVLPHTKPKAIVIGLFTGNDVQLTGREYTPWGFAKPLYGLDDKGALVRRNRGAGCINGLAQSLLFRGLWKRQEWAVSLIRTLCDPVELPRGELERAIAKMFDEIEALGRARGVPVVFALLPTKFEISVHGADWTKYIAKYGLLRRLLAEGHHETLDFYPEILRAHAPLDDLFQRDNAHMTAAGHRLLADVLERHLVGKGYIGAAP